MPALDRNPEDIIERWMLQIATDDGVDRFDDLHIDAIDPAWKERALWIEKAIEAFHIAVSVRNRNRMPFSIGLGFSLHSSDSLTGINFRTKKEFIEQLDWSPPSLYIFRSGDEPHARSASAKVQILNPAILGLTDHMRCYYLEFEQEGKDECYRSVFMEG